MHADEATARRRMTEREAARYLGAVSVRTLQDWRMRGTGPSYTKLGRRVAYDVADLDVFLAANRVVPKASRGGALSMTHERIPSKRRQP